MLKGSFSKSDVSRSDELQTKLRTLSYDHERLTSLYKASQEKAANAEREEELAKSRMKCEPLPPWT